MNPQAKRKIKLIQPSLQLQMIGAFAAICGLALLTQALVLGALLTRLVGQLPTDGSVLSQEMPRLILAALGLSAVLVLPALMLIGVRITFRVAGPLHRMKTHLDAVARGEATGACHIRKTDHLQEFCATMNAALAARAGATQRSHESAPVVREAA